MTWSLVEITREFAAVVPDVDRTAEHDRWDPGIGPFEEENQLEMILGAVADRGAVPDGIESEVPYPESGQRCDLVVDAGDHELPIEAKLLRFRLDNGNIDPNMYASVFSPFPERSSSSLLTDAKKLAGSDFDLPAGLLGIYYERETEPYEQLEASRVAEKLRQDIEFWYGFDVEVTAISEFDGLRHPHHERGAIITWELADA